MDDPVPDETTILKFRHLLEKHALTEQLFRDVGMLLTERGLLLHQGTIVDATIEIWPNWLRQISGVYKMNFQRRRAMVCPRNA